MTKAFDELCKRMWTRAGLDGLPAHLETAYGIDVAGTEQLDVGVFRVDRRDGPPWVARVFSTQRSKGAAAGDAAVLRHVAAGAFPAERPATDDPVSTMVGQEVLVTEFLPSVKRKLAPDVGQTLGRLLATLHSLPLPAAGDPAARPAGALHHFAEGARANELEEAGRWLDQIEERVPAPDRGRLDKLRGALVEADDGDGLPTSLIHPDPVPKNMIRIPDGYALVDWTGAGIAPRVVSLEWLLAGKASAAIAAGYTDLVALTEEEWSRLPGIGFGRRVIGLCFRLGFAPEKAASIVRRISAERREAKEAVEAARTGARS